MVVNFVRASWNAIRSAPFSYAFGILGLALSFAFFVLAMGYVQFESQYDRWVPNHERIYRLEIRFPGDKEIRPFGLSPMSLDLVAENLRQLPTVEKFVFTSPANLSFVRDEQPLALRALQVDTEFLNMMDVRFLAGELQPPEAGRAAVALSASQADAWYGGANAALGQTLEPLSVGVIRSLQSRDAVPVFEIVAVFEDWPGDSHLTADKLIMFERPLGSPQLYLQLGSTAGQQQIASALRDGQREGIFRFVMERGMSREQAEAQVASIHPSLQQEYSFMPIADIHLRSTAANGLKALGDADKVVLIRVASLLLLAIGGINFAGLLASRFTRRLNEFALRKVCGTATRSLVGMLLLEVITLCLVAVAIGACIAYLVYDAFQVYFDVAFEMQTAMMGGAWRWLLIAFLLIVAIAVSGPIASVLGVQPSAVFGGLSQNLSRHRPVLFAFIAVQGVLVLVVLIGVLTMSKQLHHVSTIDFAANVDDTFHTSTPLYEIINNYNEGDYTRLKNFEIELRSIPGVTDVAFGNNEPIAGAPSEGLGVEGNEERINYVRIGPNYFDLFDVSIVAGRAFDKKDFEHAIWRATRYEEVADSQAAYAQLLAVPIKVIVNRRLLARLGIDDANNALGVQFTASDLHPEIEQSEGVVHEIVGVAPDLYHGWQYGEVSRPAVYYAGANGVATGIMLRFEGVNRAEFVKTFTRLYKKSFPEYLQQNRGAQILTTWIDEALDVQLAPERRRMQLFLTLSLLVVFLSALGLYDAMQFTLNAQRREMAIRKVFGASAGSIVRRVLWFFVLPVLLANLIAWPLAHWYLNDWLSNYSTRIQLGLGVFATAALVLFAITVLVIGREALRMGSIEPGQDLLPIGAKGG